MDELKRIIKMPKNINDSGSHSEPVLELVAILQKEASLFETFLDLMEKQQKALVKNDVDELNRVTDIQREKAVESRLLSKRREALTKELASEVGSDGDLTISRLIECVSSDQALILGQLQETILDLNSRIVRVRSQNEMLINRSRENIMKTMELLGSIHAPDNNYQKEGKKTDNVRSIALDRRA